MLGLHKVHLTTYQTGDVNISASLKTLTPWLRPWWLLCWWGCWLPFAHENGHAI